MAEDGLSQRSSRTQFRFQFRYEVFKDRNVVIGSLDNRLLFVWRRQWNEQLPNLADAKSVIS
jgi:hypothetical protein